MNWLSQPVKSINPQQIEKATQRQNSLTKPPGSLGRLEELAIRLCGMLGEKPQIDEVAITVFAGDHGVAAQGVSAFPQVVTGEMVKNFATGGAAICVLARSIKAHLEVVDLGTVNHPGALSGVVDARIAPQTDDLSQGDAMSADQLELALNAGREAVGRAGSRGTSLFVGGDMGIANTTAATALACAWLDLPAVELAGPGTGLDNKGVSHKAEVIEQALALHRPAFNDPVEVLRCLGGFEIAALAGAYITCAQEGIPALVDGFIASSAALAAIRINPDVANWLLLSHASAEPGHSRMVEGIGIAPVIDLGMRLGEGSGAAVAVPLLRMACQLHNEMATFEEASVSTS